MDVLYASPVLVVNDNPEALRLISRTLSRSFRAIDTANDGAEALKMLEAKRYGLLVTDFHMPGVNGWHLAKAVRTGTCEGEHGTSRNVPIICVSATLGGATTKTMARQIGVSAFLPLDRVTELRDLAVSLLSSRARPVALVYGEPRITQLVASSLASFKAEAGGDRVLDDLDRTSPDVLIVDARHPMAGDVLFDASCAMPDLPVLVIHKRASRPLHVLKEYPCATLFAEEDAEAGLDDACRKILQMEEIVAVAERHGKRSVDDPMATHYIGKALSFIEQGRIQDAAALLRAALVKMDCELAS